MDKSKAVLQEGNIYFFLRPKVEIDNVSNLEDTQHALLLLQPKDTSKYILLVMGKKHLPEESGESYFSFVDEIYSSAEEAKNNLQEKYYTTKTRGKRKAPGAIRVGYGSYIIFSYKEHSYLAYKLIEPKVIKGIPSLFKLKRSDSFIIQVKNTNKYPHLGEKDINRKAPDFPKELSELFHDHKFIPLQVDLLYYKRAELLLISRNKNIPLEFANYLEQVKLEPLFCLS